MKNIVSKKQIQKIIDQIEKLIDLSDKYENNCPAGVIPTTLVGTKLRIAKSNLKECLESQP